MARYIDAEKCREYFDKEYKELRQQIYQGEIAHSIEAGFVGAERAIHKIPTADVVPKSEVAKEVLLDLKTAVNNKAIYPNCQGDYAFVNLKVFNAVLQTVLKKYTEGNK